MWLREQSLLDYWFSEPDGCEERLLYGLYNRSHTKDSLSAELSCTFDVVECLHEAYDPRYVIGVVKRRDGIDFATTSAQNGGLEEPAIAQTLANSESPVGFSLNLNDC